MSLQDAWQRVSTLFDAALEHPPAEREAWVRQRAGDDLELADEVLALLHVSDRPSDDQDWLTAGAVIGTPGSRSGGAAAMEWQAGQRLGPWAILRLIGRGGMGEVYAVSRVDGDYDQQAALKVIALDQPALRLRFEQERRLLARLEHPGIARILDGGSAPDGRPYMVMEYVDGEPITTYCASRQLPLETRLQLFLRACESVAYAHARLIVHRDLKPANLLVTGRGETKLLDFGIAKPLADSLDLPTRTQLLLTPRYASPEQLQNAPIGTATDIYSLAAILFEMLTGTTAVEASEESLAALVSAVISGEAPLASSRTLGTSSGGLPAAQLRGDLDAILARALRRDPDSRYRSVDALASDLRAFLEHRPVQARAGNRRYRLQRFLRRYAWQSAAVAGLVIVLGAGLVGTLWQARQAAQERDATLRTYATQQSITSAVIELMRSNARKAQSAGEAPEGDALLDADLETLRQTFPDDAAAAAALAHVIGKLHYLASDYVGATPLLEFAANDTHPLPPEVRAERSLDLADLYLVLGELEAAETQLTSAKMSWSVDPFRYRRELISLQRAEATLRMYQGRFADTLSLTDAALAAQAADTGSDSYLSIVLLNLKSIAHNQLGDRAAAITAQRRTLDVMRRVGAASTSQYLIAQVNLASYLIAAGELAEAEHLVAEAVSAREQRFGPSRDLAADRLVLARLRFALGARDEAAGLGQQAADMEREYLGDSSPLYLGTVATLAAWALLRSEPAAAADLLAALDLDQNPGVKGPDGLYALLMRAASRAAMGDAEGARADLARLDRAYLDLDFIQPAAQSWRAWADLLLGDQEAGNARYEAILASLEDPDSAPAMEIRETRALAWSLTNQRTDAEAEFLILAKAWERRLGPNNLNSTRLRAAAHGLQTDSTPLLK